MRLLVCGDRDWPNQESYVSAIRSRIEELGPDLIIHGGCRGVDSIAGIVAFELGITCLTYPAQWDKFGKAAGPIRNTQMLEEGGPDYALAFHDDLPSSRGTANMISQLIAAGIPYEIKGSGVNK